MSLPFYLTFVAVCCIFTFGINGQTSAANLPPPAANFLSINLCPYTKIIHCPSAQTSRHIDGSCNHRNSPYSAKSETPYIRLVSPSHTDKSPRKLGLSGQPLPWPRKISNDFFKSTSSLPNTLSAIASTFARFVEHDLYKTKLMNAGSCCTPTQGEGVCDNIKVANDDSYFGTYDIKCLPKGDMVPTTKIDCKTGGPLQQINENTHLLDLSNIYGSTKEVSDKLRTKRDGLLKLTQNDLLPESELPDCRLSSANPNDAHCFDAGDLRVNIDPLIMTMYTIWVRHHNAIAKKLKYTLLDANDEIIFQTARGITIAQYQHIVYNEFLQALDEKTLLKTPTEGTSSYNVNVEPTIFNSFSLVYTAIVDSMVPEKIKIGSSEIPLVGVYYKPAELFEPDGIKKILEGMQAKPAEKLDRYVVDALRDSYLQKDPGSGTDKVALNLQQSRENWAPLYQVFYHLLNQKEGGGLSEIDESITELGALYPYTFDIELLPGLFAETVVSGASYGNTTQLLMNKQFEALKEGDRFFYSHAGVFKTKQFENIKNITLAKIICNNSPLTGVAPLALELAIGANTQKTCAEFQDIDICLWSTAEWTEWGTYRCSGTLGVSTRRCKIPVGGTCKCDGSPIGFKSCTSTNSVNSFSYYTVKKIIDTFYEYFDSNGNPLDPNSTLTVIDILNEATG